MAVRAFSSADFGRVFGRSCLCRAGRLCCEPLVSLLARVKRSHSHRTSSRHVRPVSIDRCDVWSYDSIEHFTTAAWMVACCAKLCARLVLGCIHHVSDGVEPAVSTGSIVECLPSLPLTLYDILKCVLHTPATLVSNSIILRSGCRTRSILPGGTSLFRRDGLQLRCFQEHRLLGRVLRSCTSRATDTRPAS